LLRVENLMVRGLVPVSFSLDAGTCVAVRGASGSGKSLLLRAIADLDDAPGRVVLDGVERSSVAGNEWRRMVRYFQAEPGFWAAKLGTHLTDTTLISRLGLPNDAMDWGVERLSTGEKQRVSLARGLADKPSVLLLDEPTSGLDADATLAVETLITEAMSEGAHVLLVSHDLEQGRRIASRALHIVDGKMEEEAL